MPPRDVFEGGPTREQQERLEAQTGGRRGSTQGRQQDDPRDMYGPRQEGRTAQQGMSTGFDFGSGEKAGTLSQQEFMNITGRTATNPYGKQGFFSRVFGIDPSKINYAASTPGGIATLNQVNALAYDQYMNPRDAQGNIRGMLREGSPTRSGTVVYDPTMETDLGIMGMIPYVGGFMRRANRRSALNISPYDNPLFSDMSDLGNELAPFPQEPLADPLENIAPLGSPAPALSSIPTQEELRQERIRMTLDELNRGTADFPEQYEVAPTASSIPTAYELTKAQGIDFPPRILPGSVFPGDEMNVNAPGLFQ